MTHSVILTSYSVAFCCTNLHMRPILTALSLSLSLVPWVQCPLVSMTYFTKWLHFLLSIASPYRVQISLLHQSTRSSVHLLLGLPSLFLPSIMPKTACFRSLSSCIPYMWPKKFNFLLIILWAILILVPILFMISVFLIFCCHLTSFNKLLRHFISKANCTFSSNICTFQLSLVFSFAAYIIKHDVKAAVMTIVQHLVLIFVLAANSARVTPSQTKWLGGVRASDLWSCGRGFDSGRVAITLPRSTQPILPG